MTIFVDSTKEVVGGVFLIKISILINYEGYEEVFVVALRGLVLQHLQEFSKSIPDLIFFWQD
jgi:hypothetical protein